MLPTTIEDFRSEDRECAELVDTIGRLVCVSREHEKDVVVYTAVGNVPCNSFRRLP